MRLQKTGNFIMRRGISLAMRNLAGANLKEQNWKENAAVIRQKQALAVSDNGWTVKCVFCVRSKGAREDDGDLRQVSTFETDTNIRTIITELNDSRLLVRIVGGNLIVIGAKYHLKCLIELKNRYRSHVRKWDKDKQNIDENVCNSRVFVELASYVNKEVSSGKLLFKLSELQSLYESRLEGLGNAKSVNKTRLKERLLEYFKEAQEQFDGRNIFLVFKEGMRKKFKTP